MTEPELAETSKPLSHKELSTVVQGTAENLLTKLEEAVSGPPVDDEGGDLEDEEVLQDSAPGPLSEDAKDVEDVINVISQSIYREGQGKHMLIGFFLCKIAILRGKKKRYIYFFGKKNSGKRQIIKKKKCPKKDFSSSTVCSPI